MVRRIALVVVAGLALAALVMVLADNLGPSARSDLLSSHAECDAGSPALQVKEPPVYGVVIDDDESGYTVTERVTLQAPPGSSCGFSASAMSSGNPQMTVDGTPAAWVYGASTPVPDDDRPHAYAFTWSGSIGLNRAGWGRSLVVFDVLNEFPNARPQLSTPALGADPTDDQLAGARYLNSPGAELNVLAPAGRAVDAPDVSSVRLGTPSPTLYAHRVAVFPVAPGGFAVFRYAVAYTEPVPAFCAAVAPYVLAAAVAALATALLLRARRRQKTDGVGA